MTPRLILTAIFLALQMVVAAAQEVAPKIDIKDHVFENGLRLVVIPDRRAPVVTHMIWYKSGSADDPPGKSGIAHFLEHLMFKGTSNTPAGEFSQAVSSIGGQENAFTSYDYTAYYQKVSPSALGQMMKYEADRMRNLVLSEEVIIPEREVILEERSGRVDNSPSSILSEFTQAALYVRHPYGIPVIGWEHEIRQLDREDAFEFYENWYQPWNAIVVVAGDVDFEAVVKLAADTYGLIRASREESPRQQFSDPPRMVEKSLQYKDARVTTPIWSQNYVVPSYRTAQKGEAEALDLLATILGDSVSSRIYKKLVLEEELATSAGAFYQGSTRDSGYFGFYASPRGDASLADVSRAVEAEIDKILADGVTAQELERARQAYLKSLVYSQDSQVSLARIFGSILSSGGTIKDYLEWPENLRQVDVEGINSVARKYLDKQTAVTSRLLPGSE